jgi:UrcA family protein
LPVALVIGLAGAGLHEPAAEVGGKSFGASSTSKAKNKGSEPSFSHHSIAYAKEALVKTSARSALLLSICVLLGWSTSALGAIDRSDGVATKTVKFKDLDISKAEGALALYGRIAAAARTVCRPEPYTHVRSCRARAVDDAVHGVGSTLLMSIHRSAVERVEEVVLR